MSEGKKEREWSRRNIWGKNRWIFQNGWYRTSHSPRMLRNTRIITKTNKQNSWTSYIQIAEYQWESLETQWVKVGEHLSIGEQEAITEKFLETMQAIGSVSKYLKCWKNINLEFYTP